MCSSLALTLHVYKYSVSYVISIAIYHLNFFSEQNLMIKPHSNLSETLRRGYAFLWITLRQLWLLVRFPDFLLLIVQNVSSEHCHARPV